MTKKPTARRSFSDEFKQDAVNRVMAGEKLSAVARDLGVNPNNLYLWRNNLSSGSNEPAIEHSPALVPDPKDLARENELLKLEIDYMRKREALLRRK
jgi:transposase-like protein